MVSYSRVICDFAVGNATFSSWVCHVSFIGSLSASLSLFATSSREEADAIVKGPLSTLLAYSSGSVMLCIHHVLVVSLYCRRCPVIRAALSITCLGPLL